MRHGPPARQCSRAFLFFIPAARVAGSKRHKSRETWNFVIAAICGPSLNAQPTAIKMIAGAYLMFEAGIITASQPGGVESVRVRADPQARRLPMAVFFALMNMF